MEKKNINLGNYNLLNLTYEIISKLSNEEVIAVREKINELLKGRSLSSEADLKETRESKDQFYTDINAESFSATELTNIGDRITRSKSGNHLTQDELDDRVAKYLSEK